MRDDEKLVKIAEFDSEFDAELAKLALDNAGIESVVFGEGISSIKPYTSTEFNIELQVFEKDVEQARQILAEKAEQGDDEDTESDQ